MRKLKLFFACLLMAVLSIGQVWADDFSATYSYGGTDWSRSGTFSDESTYYKTDGTDDFVATVSGIFTGKTITSDVVITLDVACYGNGDAPTDEKFSIYTSSACTQQVTAAQSGTLPTDKYYKNTIYTVTAANAADFSDDLAIKVAGGTKLIRFRSFKVEFTYTTGAPSYTITAVSNNDLWGTVSGTTTISAVPEDGYRVKAGDEGYTVTSGTADVTNNGDNTFSVSASADCTVQINFEAIPQYTVTWNNHGITSSSQVYEGEKPVFPATPSSCDATSTTFIGWATAAWDGKLANTDGKTVYTSASAMPDVTGAVTYYAVYAKVSGTTGWVETAIGDLTSSDVFVLSNGSYAVNNVNKTGEGPDVTAITVTDGKITSPATIPDNIKWNIIGNATDGFTFKPNGDATKYLYCNNIATSSNNDNIRVGTQSSNVRNVWKLTSANYLLSEWTVTSTGDANRYLSIYTSGPDVRSYLNTSNNPIDVKCYKYSAGTTSDYMTTCAAAGTCEAPSFTPAAGTFDVAQDIELQTSTPSAHIYYTLDGSDPDDGSDEYTSAIHITQNTTIKAITYADGLTESSISEGVFNIRYAQPTLTASAAPVDGKYTSAITVTLAAEGADAIYYAIGETPTIDEEHKYTDPIALSTTGSKTINAIAVRAGYANSNVASQTFVLDLPYANIKAFIDGEKVKAENDRVLQSVTLSNAIITGRAANYNNQNVLTSYTLYVQDETAGIMIYALPTDLDAKAAANHSISGTIKAKYTVYKKQHEMAKQDNTHPIDLSNVEFSDDEIARPSINSYTSLSTAYATDSMKLVKLTNVKYEGVDSYYNATFGSSKIYNTFNVFNASTVWPESNVDCDITGIVIDYNGTYELLPVFASDIVADADAAAPVFTPAGGADAENAVQVDLNSYVTIAAADAKHSVDVDQVQITSTDPVSVTAVSSRDFYRSTSVTKWYYGNSASASYDINGQGSTTEGTIVAQVNSVDAPSAKENDEVHVFITPNAHFALNTITVNGSAPTEVNAGTEYKFTMPDEAVTIVVTWNEDAKATLTFAKGEATGTEDAPANIVDYIGETTQLPANPFTYSGHKFIGWSCDGGATKLAAGTDYQLAENKDFVAYWAAIPTFNDADHEWQLATSLEAGKYYVIGSASQDKTASKTISGGYMGEASSTIEDGVIAYDALGTNTAIFLLGGNSTVGWTLTEVTTDKVLGTTGNKNVSWNAGTQTWAISIAEGGNATIGGTSRILHNVNSTRFTTYNSDLSASMLLPQLYVWAEKVFKLRYDANEGSNAPAATLAVAGKATVTDERPTAPAGKIFDGWNENATGTGEDYVAGDEIAITTADVTIYAKWRDPNTYTISYNANGGTLMEGKSVIAPEDVTEGEEYSVKANVYEKEGKIFTGWQYGANIYNANDELLPTEDIEFIAQWSDPNITDYVLVTNINQLKNGDKVYIVAAATGNAMGAQYSTTYRQRVEIEKTADKSHVITTGTEPVELTLGTTDGSYYTFNDGTGYLYANSTSANNIGTQEDLTDAGKWTITIDAEGNTTIVSQGKTQYNKLNYNAAQPRFAAYKNAQQAVVLYKKLETIREDGVAPGVWGTICPKNEIVNAEGASFFQISHVEYHSGIPYKVFYDEIAEGACLAAGQPYLFLADENATAIKGFKVGNDVTSATNDHGFIGVLSDKLITVEAADVTAYRYYIVYDNEIRLCGEGQFRIKAERAYLDMSDPNVEKQYKAPIAGRRRVALTNNAVQNATGCENINASETPVKMIIDGQLYILRGEKMYDATGKLVK